MPCCSLALRLRMALLQGVPASQLACRWGTGIRQCTNSSALDRKSTTFHMSAATSGVFIDKTFGQMGLKDDLGHYSRLLELEVWAALVHIAVVTCSPPAANLGRLCTSEHTKRCVHILLALACILSAAQGQSSPPQMAW